MRAAFLSGLPVSAAAHFLAIGIATIVAVLDFEFPKNAPSQFSAYSVLSAVPVPPPARMAAALPPKTVKVTPPRPDKLFSPEVIPDEIPLVLPASQLVSPNEGTVGGVEGGMEGGVVGGSVGGDASGSVSGEKNSVSLAVAAPHNLVIIPLDATLPLVPLSKVYPIYPERARMNSIEGSLVVRYYIDLRGRVREVQIVRPAKEESFNKSAASAIRGWRFQPYRKDGTLIEVMHELTIYFQLEHS